MGLISVIIPVFNRQEYISQCLRSVQNQSWQNFEVLVIDDGSTDETVKICREFAAADPRITLLEGEHAGVSAARNKGIDAAKGDYLFFLDSDDVIHPVLLETLVNAMKHYGASIARTQIANVPDALWHKVEEQCACPRKECEILHQDFQQSLEGIFRAKTPFHGIGGVMLRADLVGQSRFSTELFIGEDFWFTYENMIKGAEKVICQEKLYYVRMHDTNSSWNYGYDAFWSRFRRRELVWKSEENFGRREYADIQKRDALNVFLLCLQNSGASSEDSKKMRRTMRLYRHELLPALNWKGKLCFLLGVYMPSVYLLARRKKRAANKHSVG